jgi:hypothetical protein
MDPANGGGVFGLKEQINALFLFVGASVLQVYWGAA